MSAQPNGKRGDLDELKARVDLVALIQQSGVALKKAGKSYKGLCPFHPEDTPSFSVSPDAQLFNCLGCQTGGDLFRFLQLKEELTFPQAVQRARELAGELPPALVRLLPGQQPLPGRLSRCELLASVAQRYAEALQSSEPARAYLASRALADPVLAEAFQLGYADGQLLKAVPQKGEVREALEQVGLITSDGREFFADCIVVPLSHPELGMLSLYGRKISPRAKTKHLYLPGPKRGVLNWQGLQCASERIVLTESVLDALSVWVSGQKAVSCLYGVQGLPPDLEEALTRFAVREVQLCLDADEAGQKAALRLAERLTTKGFLCWNTLLPEGKKDPNQVLLEMGPSALRAVVARHREPFPGLEPPDSLATQSDEEGLRLSWENRAVAVTPHPPFRSRLRITLRVDKAYRHTFELTSYRNRAQTARDLARCFPIEVAECERFLMELLEPVESWVKDWKERQQAPQARQAPAMSEADRQEALAFLKAPDLVQRLLADMEAMGTVGEIRAKLMAYLIVISRKLEFPLSGILVSQSAAGKSGITELVEALCPEEEVVWYSRMSPMALYNMASDYLKRKAVMVEESVGSKAAEYPIRVLQSRQKLVQVITLTDPTTGKMRAQENEVEGPIAYLETTTDAKQVHYENATRCFLIHLDESEEQTRRIHAHQRLRRLGKVSSQSLREPICRRHQNAQRLLEFAVVRIPFVEKLSFPSRWLRTRRDHERFLCLIEAVAFLHQHQRKQGLLEDGTRYLEASPDDYRIAYDLAQEVLAQTFHELTRDARDLLEATCEMLSQGGPREGLEKLAFTRKDLRAHTQWQDHRLRDALQELVQMEYLQQTSGGQGRTCFYQVEPGASSGTRLGPIRELTPPDELDRLWPA